MSEMAKFAGFVSREMSESIEMLKGIRSDVGAYLRRMPDAAD
jgi:hypothetical protein